MAIYCHTPQPLAPYASPLVSPRICRAAIICTLIRDSEQSCLTFTGFTPAAVDELLAQITPKLDTLTLSGRQRQRVRSLKLLDSEQLMLTLIWLRQYYNYGVLASFFGVDTLRVPDYLHRVMLAIHETLNTPHWPMETEWETYLETYKAWTPPHLDGCIAIIDGTEWRISRPSKSDAAKKVFSGKKWQHSLNVLVMCLPDGRLIDISRVQEGVAQDQSLWKATGWRQNFIGKDYGIIGDGGFTFNTRQDIGEIKGYTPIRRNVSAEQVYLRPYRRYGLSAQELAYNKHLSSYRQVIENVFSRLKRWRIIGGTYRHWRANGTHRFDPNLVFRVVCELLQTQLVNAPIRKEPWRSKLRPEQQALLHPRPPQAGAV